MISKQALWARKWRANNPDKSRANSRKVYYKRKYGLSLEEHAEIFEQQNRCCAICKTTEPGGTGWHTDHDHVTGEVRGILCISCNMGLGRFKDDPQRLRAAIEYLEAH